MRAEYRTWLEDQKYESGTITAQLHRAGRVEDCYGNLDDHFASGTLQGVIDELTYSAEDERVGKPNPSKIPFNGNTRNNLASYKNAVVRYRKFLTGWERSDADVPLESENTTISLGVPHEDYAEIPAQKLSLERDMQAALRREIRQLSASLIIIDDGAERSVASGFIDITCCDQTDNSMVVVELKAGRADSRAIAQILGYMGDLAEEEPNRKIRGLLVAHEFDRRTKSAARVVPTLGLIRYSVKFHFEADRS